MTKENLAIKHRETDVVVVPLFFFDRKKGTPACKKAHREGSKLLFEYFPQNSYFGANLG